MLRLYTPVLFVEERQLIHFLKYIGRDPYTKRDVLVKYISTNYLIEIKYCIDSKFVKF